MIPEQKLLDPAFAADAERSSARPVAPRRHPSDSGGRTDGSRNVLPHGRRVWKPRTSPKKPDSVWVSHHRLFFLFSSFFLSPLLKEVITELKVLLSFSCSSSSSCHFQILSPTSSGSLAVGDVSAAKAACAQGLLAQAFSSQERLGDLGREIAGLGV